jgi:hypothetical protein
MTYYTFIHSENITRAKISSYCMFHIYTYILNPPFLKNLLTNHTVMLLGSLFNMTWSILKLQMEENASRCGGLLQICFIISCGHPTKGRLPASGWAQD